MLLTYRMPAPEPVSRLEVILAFAVAVMCGLAIIAFEIHERVSEAGDRQQLVSDMARLLERRPLSDER